MIAWYWLILAYAAGVATPIVFFVLDFLSAINNLRYSTEVVNRHWLFFGFGVITACACLSLACLVWIVVQVAAFFVLG